MKQFVEGVRIWVIVESSHSVEGGAQDLRVGAGTPKESHEAAEGTVGMMMLDNTPNHII